MGDDSLQFITDRYQIFSMLGRGHSGTVYRAGDTILDKSVALKVLHIGTDSTKVVRFQNEARIVARLDHPNIVRVLDFNLFDKNKMYIVFELIEGQSLRSMIDDRGVIPVSEWLPLAEGILSGLEHAHSNGVTHRDLNPNNVLVDFANQSTPQAKIVDFGIACLQDFDQRLTRQGAAVGTPEYMSPEQCRGQGLNQTSDIYSFGCVCFSALTGRPPHRTDNLVETLMAHTSVVAPRLSDVRPDLSFPELLEVIVAKSLAHNPAHRYQSATQLLAEFKALAESLTSDAESIPALPHNVTLPAVKSMGTIAWVLISIVVCAFAATVATALSSSLFASKDHQYNLRRIAENEKVELSALKEGEMAILSNSLGGNTSTAAAKKYEKMVVHAEGGQTQFTPLEEFQAVEANSKVASAELNVDSVIDVQPGDMQLLKSVRRANLERTGSGVYHLRCFNDDDMKLVRDLKDITQLYVSASYSIRGPGLKYLSGLSLQTLEFKKSLIDDAGLAYLPASKILTSLSLTYDRKISGTTFSAEKTPNLTYLNLQLSGVTDEGLRNICNLKHLQMLLLNDSAITGATLGDIARLPDLRQLSIAHAPIESRYLSSITSAPKLVDLNLDGLKISDYDFLYKLKYLRSLSINDSSITDRQLAALLRNCTSITELSIKRCAKLTKAGLASLIGTKIRNLCISRDRSSDDLVEILIQCKSLSDLDAEKTKLSFEAVHRLLSKSNIKSITVSEPITEFEFEQLRTVFPQKKIRYVEF
ncbi:MAG: protein kinase [Candidatus Obscuribacterales bacterium]|nr:protein kinase [Candidatus Obscuribacterales bacterium]